MDTIFALSSGAGRAGVAVIRVSGPQSLHIGKTLSGLELEPRLATLAKLHDGAGELLDHAVLIAFPNPKSFTGEDVLEIHCHGGAAVIAALLKTLGEFDQCRAAEAGEFTRRAFVNGKMDLSEIEGLGDLLSANTELQRRAALRETIGTSRALYTRWRSELLQARALLEALIDFSDEEGVPQSMLETATTYLTELHADIARHLHKARSSEILRDGLTVVIAGPPNAGKSSLLNALSRRDVAIVTDEPGTTRDMLEVHLNLDGYPLTFVDTAGLRDAQNKVEQEGIRRALSRAQSADLVLWLHAPDATDDVPEDVAQNKIWHVATKCDLSTQSGNRLSLSTKTGEGVDALLQKLSAFAKGQFGAQNEDAVFLRERHRQLLQVTSAQLEKIIPQLASAPLEISAEHLRVAAEPLERVMGYIGADELLGAIFSRFCIGK